MTKGRKHRLTEIAVWILLGVCALLVAFTFSLARSPGDTRDAAEKVEKIVAKRLGILDGYIEDAMSQDCDEWMHLAGLPSDMVVYRYVKDSLQSWSNQFPITNDEISHKVLFQRLTNPKSGLSSQLSQVTSEVSYLNLGAKWYLVKSVAGEECKIIAGLEIVNTLDDNSRNGSNPRLKLGNRFTIAPLTNSGGDPVCVDGVPKFKILNDLLQSQAVFNSYMIWLAYASFVIALILFLINKRSCLRFAISSVSLLLATVLMYFWGLGLQSEVEFFSPLVYAHGAFFYSLGAVILVNIGIVLMVLCVFLFRRDLYRRVCSFKRPRAWLAVWSVVVLLFIIELVAYTLYVFRSIVRNSGITLELYMLDEITPYTALVYGSFISVLMMIPLLLQLLRPGVRTFLGFDYNAVSNKSRFFFAILFSIYLVIISSTLGFKKESGRIGVWANMLSIDRDIALELELRSAEDDIADDILISTLTMMENSGSSILNRLTDSYLYGISQSYDISATVLRDGDNSSSTIAYFNERVSEGTPVAPGSKFLYSFTENGLIRYTGVFVYFHQNYGVTRLLVGVEPKNAKESLGYARLLGISGPGQISIPSGYDYAKYKNNDIVQYRGNYAYPTKLGNNVNTLSPSESVTHLKSEGYTHFIKSVADDEIVVISRPSISLFNYFLSFALIALVSYLGLSLLTRPRKDRTVRERSYYKSRVSYVLVVSLFATLVIMATVSVVFVYRRNDSNLKVLMSDKISSVQAILQESFKDVRDARQLLSPDYYYVLQNVCNISRSDITLYSVSGSLLISSNMDIFDRMILGTRVEQDAYENIVFKDKRFFFKRERAGSRDYYAMYAPVFNASGSMVAIMCSPYVDENFDLMMEAVWHSVSIVTVFLILLLIARFMVLNIVGRMFKPLTEMGRKMIATKVSDLEYIEYDNDDEISSLVKAYNRMVKDLSESTLRLADAERDKAWSAMARQVAHEIKNPLTPMKLQIQRIIRLKERNAPDWQQKFDEVVKIVLDHIDILTDTANEFSTFAKLYSEEHTLIDVDALLTEEVMMYDGRENIEISYIGLPGAMVKGPKPQLTRVFVNLINNAVQALEDRPDGKIMVSLRKSTADGFYDIVFEDNGPGVAEENIPRLFSPNFTTKSSGTGLGLAICRSILEQCGAAIHYSKSFVLQGACFTVSFPVDGKTDDAV